MFILFISVEAPRSPTPPPIIKYHYGKLKGGKKSPSSKRLSNHLEILIN